MTTKNIKPTFLEPPYKFDDSWENILENKEFLKIFLSDILENFIIKQRWYGGKASKIKYIELSEYFRMQQDDEVYYGLILEVNFIEGFYQRYFLPIAFVSDENFAQKDRILNISVNGVLGFVIDAINLEAFRKVVFNKITNAEYTGKNNVEFHKNSLFTNVAYESSRFMGLEQSNTSIVYNEKYVLKFFRRIYVDKNPDYEMSRFLSEKKEFKNTPRFLGSVNIIDAENTYITIALMQEMVTNEGDAWDYMLTKLHNVFLNLGNQNINVDSLPSTDLYLPISITEIPEEIINWVGIDLFKKIQGLATRTAEMHIALGSEIEDTAFTPSHFNADYEVWLKNRMLYQFQNRLNLIENNIRKLEGLSLDLANDFLDNKNNIRKRFINFDWTKLKGERIRVHGDYHLGQILVQDDDFYILDFEGEPESTIRDRKVKQPPLKDVAGLFRSFHYAIYANIFNNIEDYKYSQEDLFKAGEVLYRYFIGLFLKIYETKVQDANLNIGYHQERIFILKYCLLEKAVYELGYELNSRPRWALIPLKGISNIITN
jgi:maltose alpha-D-glucosyltransferase/alpha-amylase